MRGGEQQEANEQSVGDELDSASRLGEPAGKWRNLNLRGKCGLLNGATEKGAVSVVGWLEMECSES